MLNRIIEWSVRNVFLVLLATIFVIGAGVSIGATGNHPCASWTGLLNRSDLTWDRELLQGLPVRADVLTVAEARAAILEALSRRTGSRSRSCCSFHRCGRTRTATGCCGRGRRWAAGSWAAGWWSGEPAAS